MSKVAICIAPDYEDSELDIPGQRLRRAEHGVQLVGPRLGTQLKGERRRSWISVQTTARDLKPAEKRDDLEASSHAILRWLQRATSASLAS
jgi:putative intracellular protease/amidase